MRNRHTSVLVEHWERALKNDRLTNAYLVVGGNFGQYTRALQTMLRSLGITVNESFLNHPDVALLGCEGSAIAVEDVRVLKSRFALHAMTPNGWRVVLIEKASGLSNAAANALLKLLEEPGLRMLFILFARSEEQVLATIKSRCHVVYENTSSASGDVLDRDSEEYRQCVEFLQAQETERFALAERIFQKDNKRSAAEWEYFMSVWQGTVRLAWRAALARGEVHAARLRLLLEGLQGMQAGLQVNAHPRLLFDRLIITG